MSTLVTIILFGLLMSLIALVGSISLLLPDQWLKKSILPMVAFAAGSLWGGAMFHMLPRSFELLHETPDTAFILLTAGFLAFFVLEHVLHWHHCHHSDHKHIHKPIGPLVLVADAFHNFLGGLTIGALFVVDIRLGVAAWVAAALHEIPQEIGDFGLLLHSGFSKKQALWFNFLSSLGFLLGSLISYFMAGKMNIYYFIPFTAGNFIYIAAADLIPELIQHEGIKEKLLSLLFFCLGIICLYLTHSHHVH